MRRFRKETVQEFEIDENHPELLKEWEYAKDHYCGNFEDFIFQMIEEEFSGIVDWFEVVGGSIEFFEIQERVNMVERSDIEDAIYYIEGITSGLESAHGCTWDATTDSAKDDIGECLQIAFEDIEEAMSRLENAESFLQEALKKVDS